MELLFPDGGRRRDENGNPFVEEVIAIAFSHERQRMKTFKLNRISQCSPVWTDDLRTKSIFFGNVRAIETPTYKLMPVQATKCIQRVVKKIRLRKSVALSDEFCLLVSIASHPILPNLSRARLG